MLNELLEYAERHQLTVGLRVRPLPEGFSVSIWMGPGTGERSEWKRDFDRSIPRMDAIAELSAETFHTLTKTPGER